MASYGYTFQSGDGVTPTRLNDARTVSEIVNADIKSDAAIAATKLASDSITNTQIKSDAAIAGTKIAPDFGSQNAATTGNVTAAKLIPTGTSATGNGMYLPATNAVAFSTNGSERMRIDASGNVGIGTASPAAPLHVVGSSVFGTINVSSTSANAEASIGFFDSGDANSDKWVIGKNVGGVTSDAFCFYKNGNLAVIDASGRVGIGTSSPGAALHVVRSASGGIRVSGGQSDYTGIQLLNASGVEAQFHANANSSVDLRAVTNHSLNILTNNTERVRIKATGQVRFVPLSADPAGAEAGDVYYNSSSNKLKVYNGSSWVDLH